MAKFQVHKLKPTLVYFDKENRFNVINKGTKLFQLCAPDLSHFDVKIVDSLPESSRGSDGFGSTGK